MIVGCFAARSKDEIGDAAEGLNIYVDFLTVMQVEASTALVIVPFFPMRQKEMLL
ncbi:MAG: hypothetical protein ACOC6B_05535 [Thermodesulfobacteriota bacterium]